MTDLGKGLLVAALAAAVSAVVSWSVRPQAARPSPAPTSETHERCDCPDVMVLTARLRALERGVSELRAARSRQTNPASEDGNAASGGEALLQAVDSALNDERAQKISRRVSVKQESDLALLEEFRSGVEISDAAAKLLQDAYFGATAEKLKLISEAEDGIVPWDEARAAMAESQEMAREAVRDALTADEYAALVEVGKKHATVLYLEETEPAKGETPIR